jgi:large subunit ribosomal protein L30
MANIKITQVRSVIKRPKDQKLTMVALGLRRMGMSNTVTDTPSVRGMIRKVDHLVKVEEA